MKILNIFQDKSNRSWAVVSEILNEQDITQFNLRVIDANENTLGEHLLVASDEFFNYIHPGEWSDKYEGFATDFMNMSEDVVASFAENSYNDIFFFTDEYTLNNASDKELISEVAEENPDFFKLK